MKPGDEHKLRQAEKDMRRRAALGLANESWVIGCRVCLEGQGDLVSRLIMGIIGVTIWVIGVIDLLTKSP